MNSAQRWVVVLGLCLTSALLILIFWRVGNRDYAHAFLVWPPDGHYGTYGLRLRMRTTGVVCGLILPMILLSAAAFLLASNKHDD